MTTRIQPGATTWSMTRDQDGHRDYRIMFRVISDITDGPANVLSTVGLPRPGDRWQFEGDLDQWAFCRQPATVNPVLKGEPNTEWDVEFAFTTKSDDKRCKDQQIEDPLSIAPRVSGTFQKYQEEATKDRFGSAITNSAWEQIRGPQVEFDRNRPTVRIEMNVPSFISVILAYQMIDRVNSRPLWGFNKRCIKLSNAPWEVAYYGQCFKYYKLTLEFDIRPDGFDRDILDEGTKVLHGHWGDDGSWVIDPIGGISAPIAPQLSSRNTRDGELGLAAGVYSYRVTALNDTGETEAGPASTITLLSNKVITVKWAPVAGAVNYHVFGRSAGVEKQFNTLFQIPFFEDGSNAEIILTAVDPPTVNNTGKIEADNANPQHFDHAKDRNGENIRLPLDGTGQPAGVQNSNSSLYISLSTHKGQQVTDTTVWREVKGPINPVAIWDTTKAYVIGNLVRLMDAPNADGKVVSGKTYIAIANTTGDSPPDPTKWLKVTDITVGDALNPFTGQGGPGVINTGILIVGQWDLSTEYDAGECVKQPPAAGTVYVSIYEEADFLLLGIPITF